MKREDVKNKIHSGCCRWCPISIHALLAESDLQSVFSSSLSVRFLSTLSLRRATPMRTSPSMTAFYFYPRSPCGERLRAP